MLRAIYKRQHKKYRAEAVLHGMEIPELMPDEETFKAAEISAAEEDLMQKALLAARERKAQELKSSGMSANG